MEIRSGLLELSVTSHVSAIKGCPLSRVPLYMIAKGGASFAYSLCSDHACMHTLIGKDRRYSMHCRCIM